MKITSIVKSGLQPILFFVAFLIGSSLAIVRPATASIFPVGHLEPLMGNTGVALLKSPAGLIYNPALLGTLDSSSLSASANSYYIVRMEGSGEGSASASSFNSVPTTLVSTWKMGRGSLAAGILVPESIEITVDATIPGSYNSVNGTFNSRQSVVNSRTLAGLGWGQNAFVCGDECEIHLGASLFLSYQSAKRNLFVSFTEPSDRNALFTAQDGSASSFSLQSSFGGIWEISSTWAAGFRIDLPSVLLKVDRKGFQSYASVVDNSGTEILQTIQTDVADGAPALAQWGVSGGLQWAPAGAWSVLADINVFEARRSVESGPTSAASSDVGGGFRYAFDSKWATMVGTRFSLQDLFKAGESTGDRTLDWLTSIGVSMASEHLESTFGFFADRVVLLERRTVSDGTFAFSSEKTEVYGLLLSGLYRF